MNRRIKLPICVGVLTLIAALDLLKATTPIVYPGDSGMIDVTKAPYTADPTGVNDSTATIQAAVTANIGVSPVHTIYFPAGTYRITSTIKCVTTAGAAHDRMSFQGAGQGVTILKLDPNLPAFQSTTTPAGVIRLNNIAGNSTNDGLENNVWDMTIDVGVGNPGAIGLDWSCNNLATIRDVTVQSSDPNFAGYAGIYCDGWPGPSLIKNVTITGFNYGVYVRSNQLGVTIDNATLAHQTSTGTITGYGIYNNGNGVFMRHITSTNAVSAVYAGTSGLTVMTQNCTLTGTGTGSSLPAIKAQANNTPIYLRHVTTTGYNSLVTQATTVGSIPTGEYSSQPVTRLFNNAEAGLLLDPTTPDAPEFYDSNMTHWADVTNTAFAGGAKSDGSADCTAAVNAAISSGATIVYFPMGTYLITGTVHVNGSVVEIFGNQSVINTSSLGTIANPGTIFNIENGTSPYVILDRLFFQDVSGVYNTINQATTRQLIIRDSNVGNYANSVTGGSVYLENTQSFSGTVTKNTLYAWQMDTELNFPKIINNDSTFWVLGLKTEAATTAIQTINGGKTEVLGGFMFSNSPTWDTPIFSTTNSQFFGSFEQFNSSSTPTQGFYADVVRETESGVTKDLHSWDTAQPLSIIAAYSDNSAAPVHAVPTASITSPTEGQVFTAGGTITISDSAAAGTGSLSNYVIEAIKPLQAQNTPTILATSATTYAWPNVAPGNYTLYVKATDTTGVIGYSAPVHIIVKPSLTAAGIASMEYWENNGQQWLADSVSGLVSQLEIFPKYTSDTPDLLTYPTSLSVAPTVAGGTGEGRSQGMRVHGYLVPTVSGSYTFSISSSACSAFWLSTDSTVGNKQITAVNDGTLTPGGTFTVNSWRTDNTSDPVMLTAGTKYYFEAVQAFADANHPVHASSPPHVEVAWTGPGIAQQVIPGANLLPYDPTVSETFTPPAGTIYPEADAWVRGGGTDNANFGNEPTLYVSTSDYPGVQNFIDSGLMQTYSRYDLSSLSGSITKATLWMYVDSTQTGDSDQLEMALQPGGDTYTEDGLTFNNSPGLTTASTAGPWTPVAGQWVQQDVTALVQAAYANDPNKKFSFGITHTGTLTKTLTTYSSKEDAQSLWPHLVVTTTGGGGKTAFVTGQTLGTLSSGHNGGIGFQFTVGSSPITVYSLGRYMVSGNTGTHALTLVQVSNNAVLGTVTVAMSGATPGTYVYGTLTTPIALAANTSYYVQSAEVSPGDQYYSENTTVTTTAAGTITNAEDSASGNRWFTGTLGSNSYGPVNFTYSSP